MSLCKCAYTCLNRLMYILNRCVYACLINSNLFVCMMNLSIDNNNMFSSARFISFFALV